MNKTFGILFILTGIFAIIGGLFTWGKGFIFIQKELFTALIPLADIILTGPISIISGYGIIKNRNWGSILGLVTSGIYLFGSILVFITIVWNHDYSIKILVPSITGFSIGLCFVLFMMKKEEIGR
jgi:uncharacterized membrane protein (DUF2068 family)